jgi:hypothetical protein
MVSRMICVLSRHVIPSAKDGESAALLKSRWRTGKRAMAGAGGIDF